MINGAATLFSISPNSNQLMSVSGGMNATYGYNADGNLASIDGEVAYLYGPFNRMINTSGVNYAISAEGQRLEKAGASGTTYFAPAQNGTLMAEDDGGSWVDYVWLNGRLVTVVGHEGVFQAHDDQTGRPVVLSDENSQGILWEATELPFGRGEITANEWGNFNLGFPGQYYDSESGLWHNGARDYNPLTGRYIESDPIGLAGGINTYAYVGNNPISNVDPLGLCDQQKCTAAQAEVAALGQQLSSIGKALTWTGIGLVGVSGLAAIVAPEGAELEFEGGIDGAEMIEFGGNVSIVGSALMGYARDGAVGAVEAGGASFVLGRINNFAAGLGAASGVSAPNIQAVAGLLDQASDAVLQEQAACDGH